MCLILRANLLRLFSLAMVSGTLLTVARAETFTAYDLGINFTNPTASYWSVNGAPETTGTTFLQIVPVARSSSIQTDNTGKITGSGLLQVTYNANGLPFSVFSVTYAGQLYAPAGAPVTATVFIHGSGYTVDGTGGPTTTLNAISLKFVGQPGINPLNSNQLRLVGQFTGALHGPTPLGAVGTTLPSLQAVIPGSSSNLVSLSTTVLQSQTRMLLFDTGFSGAGVVGSTGAYHFGTFGTGPSHGALFLLSGSLGSYTNQIGPNQVPFSAPVSAQLTGKIKGQVVSGSADPSQLSPSLVH